MANISTAIRLSGNKEFINSVKEVSGQLGNLKTAMRATSEEFKNNANSVEALRAKQENLNQQIKFQENILETANQHLKKYKLEHGEGSAAVVKMTNTVNQLREALFASRNEYAGIVEQLNNFTERE